MKVLENCKCMFRVEHKLIKNDNLTGIIGHYEVDYFIRYNFGLCDIPRHRQIKLEQEENN